LLTALRDIEELRQVAAHELGIAELQPWDVSYASEKLREKRYSYSDHELKQYFTEPRVLTGLFKVIETLFSVSISQETAPVWHPDVKFYRIESLQGELVGQFYLDLYARDHKQGGAWQDDARSRRARRTQLATPVSFLTCNFSRPTGGKAATFKHDEVLTLFHEFGHGLHHMLTRVDEPAVSGIRGVEWDAVELPSQFMENFAWEWDVLQLLTALRRAAGHCSNCGAAASALKRAYNSTFCDSSAQKAVSLGRLALYCSRSSGVSTTAFKCETAPHARPS